ncbi:MAG TPA: fused MFS/spermidine synthase [Terracidiphilus sp.]|nr:fused MFS/spermidine synthase [Terracidiphilus sp.]
MFLSAALLFLVEPMIGKMLLPLLGGTPAVWNTCLVFFQAVLLAGYLYAHAVLRFLGRRAQVVLHLAVLLSPLVIAGLLPPHLPAGWNPPAETNPAGWVLLLLLVVIGLPFFALSATTSMMQRWYADSGREDAGDPYFLYAASNAGSLLGLLSFPLALEPALGLNAVSRLWSAAYTLLVALIAICAVMAWRWRTPHTNAVIDEAAQASIKTNRVEHIAWSTRLRWIALAFIPSSLMLGITLAMTTDVPAIPLFWVMPLAVYLISFVLVFAKKPPISHQWLVKRLPFLILCGICPTISQGSFSLPVLLLLYLTVLFGLAVIFHGELAQSRPAVGNLTEFYLCLSIGGVLGGAFNSLLAPVIFKSVMELPLVLIFAAAMRPLIAAGAGKPGVWDRRKDWLLPTALGLCMAAVILGLAHTGIKPGHVETTLVFGYSMLWCLSFGSRRLRFVLGMIALWLASGLYAPFGRTLDTERSFFGVYRVRNSPDGRFRLFYHGAIAHGTQSLDSKTSREPLAYYTRSGPIGAVMTVEQQEMPHGDLAVVGLGAGAMACYMQPGQTLTYYEIDPLVAKIAEDTRYFTLLSQCDPETNIVMGDARLKLKDAPDNKYNLIVLDAFNGDAIPMHLVTREALALYLRKLAPGGLLAFNVSSLYFNMAPTLGNLAADAHLTALEGADTLVTPAELNAGKLASTWVVMARDPDDLAPLYAAPHPEFAWEKLNGQPHARLWTDDYSNLLSVVKSFSAGQ